MRVSVNMRRGGRLLPLLLGVAALSAPAAAAPGENVQRARYEVYAGGINAVTATLDVAEGAGRYSVDVVARTKGFLARIVPWEGTFLTKGWLGRDGMRPELHRSTALSSDGLEVKEYRYGRDGSFRDYSVVEDGKDKTPEALDPALTGRTTDALTAALAAMTHASDKGACQGSAEIFDGDRRFRLTFRHEANEILEASRYNIYAGPAARCIAEVTPLEGRWSKKPRGWLSIQEQGRKAGSLPTVWMASLEKGAPAMPVKMRVKTDYGTLFMHMAAYDAGAASPRKPAGGKGGKAHD